VAARIRVSVTIDAPPDVVWDDVRDIATHVEWMQDAVAIRFTGEAREGVGAAFDCDTRVGPLALTDRMEITEWDEGRAIGVRHVGLVTGVGRFTLEPVDDGRTLFTWDEQLRFPWWLGGPVGAVGGGLVLQLVWRRNLQTLAARF
jgi:hypothetical protein